MIAYKEIILINVLTEITKVTFVWAVWNYVYLVVEFDHFNK